jgi:hypothetical protein
MKTRFSFLTALIFTGLLMFSCANEKEPAKEPDMYGRITGHSECKHSIPVRETNETADTLSCVEYSFDEANNTLLLHHINAGFNCCPGNLSCTVTISRDTILVSESEQFPMCNCNCLYDLDIEVFGVEKRIYQIRFIEPYIGNQQPLIFEADLPESAIGSFCAKRLQYPWGLSES